MDWSMLSCSRNGHVTFAPDEPQLRAELTAALPAEPAWRCLRCGLFVPGPASLSGPAASAPIVPRGKEIRSKLILRLFAVERFLRAVLFGALAVALWRFVAARASIEAALNHDLRIVRDVFRDLGVDVSHSKIYGLVQHALTLSGTTALLLAIGVTAYAAIEVVEGTGLWLARRWGEYFAMVATSLGLPLEIYDLTRKVSWIALVLLALNLALVLYLVITKRLFGVRGGKEAYDARLRSESVLEAAAKAAAARGGIRHMPLISSSAAEYGSSLPAHTRSDSSSSREAPGSFPAR
jgi:uncharacterized membrane protein (DUF2068 family)